MEFWNVIALRGKSLTYLGIYKQKSSSVSSSDSKPQTSPSRVCLRLTRLLVRLGRGLHSNIGTLHKLCQETFTTCGADPAWGAERDLNQLEIVKHSGANQFPSDNETRLICNSSQRTDQRLKTLEKQIYVRKTNRQSIRFTWPH